MVQGGHTLRREQGARGRRVQGAGRRAAPPIGRRAGRLAAVRARVSSIAARTVGRAPLLRLVRFVNRRSPRPSPLALRVSSIGSSGVPTSDAVSLLDQVLGSSCTVHRLLPLVSRCAHSPQICVS